jgi:hypothetical protein
MAILRNVPVQWASVTKPNTMFEPAWEIQVTLTPEQAKALVAEAKAVNPKGIKVKNEDDGTKTFRFKRRVAKADGSGENKGPVVCGPGGKDDVFDKLIGNGSICNIQYGFAAYDNKFGKGVVTDLKGVQVMVHVPYGVQDGDEFGSADTAPAKKADDSYDDGDF